MKKNLKGIKIILILSAFIYTVGCTTVPLVGRRQMAFIPSSQMTAMGEKNYKEVLSQVKLSKDVQKTEMIKRVGKNTAAAAEKFLTEKGMGAELKNYKWEFNLIDDDKTVNAWAMPGGKIAFYTGILKLAETEDEIAVVMGHEIAHVVAKHGNERMSQTLLVQFGSVALDKILQDKPAETKNIFMSAFGAGAQVGVLLPFSRKHEYEADEIGLNLMFKAGYEPQAAVRFWQKMMALSEGSPPEFLSTHPASANRVKRMQENIPLLH